MRRFAIFVVLSVLFFGSYNPNLKAVDNTEGGVQTFSVNSLPPSIISVTPEDRIARIVSGEYFLFTFTVRTDSPAEVFVYSPFLEEVMYQSIPAGETTLEFSAGILGVGTATYTVWVENEAGHVSTDLTVEVSEH